MPLKISPLVTFQNVTSDPNCTHLLRALLSLVIKSIAEAGRKRISEETSFMYLSLKKQTTQFSTKARQNQWRGVLGCFLKRKGQILTYLCSVMMLLKYPLAFCYVLDCSFSCKVIFLEIQKVSLLVVFSSRVGQATSFLPQPLGMPVDCWGQSQC